MYSLVVTPEIQNEIEALKKSDIDAAATALILLDELAGDQWMLEGLCTRGNHFQYHPPFEAYAFELAKKHGYNIYILKFRDDDDGSLPGYRLLVGFHAQRSTYYALALAPRAEAYADGSDAYRTLRARYEHYGIPFYR